MDDGDTGLAEGVCDLGFAETRGVVFKGDGFAGVVDVKAAEAIEVGEFAEALELFVAEGRVEFVGDFEECHERNYISGGRKVASDEWRVAREKIGRRNWKLENRKWGRKTQRESTGLGI